MLTGSMTATHHDEESGPRPNGSPREVFGPRGDRGRHDELHEGAQEDGDPPILLLRARRGGAARDKVIGGMQARVRDGEEEDAEEGEGEENAPRASVEGGGTMTFKQNAMGKHSLRGDT